MPNNKVRLPWSMVSTDSTTEKFWPSSGWMPTQGVQRFRAEMEIRNIGTDMSVGPGYQVADCPKSPTATIYSINPGAQTANGLYFVGDSGYTSAGSEIKGKALVRFGWNVKLTTGSTLALAQVSGAVEIVTT